MDMIEATVAGLSNGLAEGRFDSRDLVQAYLDRIVRYEDRVNATAAISASARAEAEKLDASAPPDTCADRCTAFRSRIKDNINTTSMPTTGGAWPSPASCRPTTRRS